MVTPLEMARNQVMSTRAVFINSLSTVASQRDAALTSIRASLNQGQSGEMGVLSRISSIRAQFQAPTAQQAGQQNGGGILGGGGILSQGGILGRLQGQNGGGQVGAQQQGILARIQSIRSNILGQAPGQPGVTGAPTSSFLGGAPPERVGSTSTPTPMGDIKTDTSVQNLGQKGSAPTTLGQIEVD